MKVACCDSSSQFNSVSSIAVSYTHLDVYKRQLQLQASNMEQPCNNLCGRSLCSYVQRHPQLYVLGPSSPIHVPPRGHMDLLEIIVVKDLACPVTVDAVSDLSSDHNPVLIIVLPTLDTPLQPPRHVQRVNWRSCLLYTSHETNSCTSS